MTERTPAEPVDPRICCREALAARGLVVGVMPSAIRWWLEQPERALDDRIARNLALLFGTSAALWGRLDEAWRGRER